MILHRGYFVLICYDFDALTEGVSLTAEQTALLDEITTVMAQIFPEQDVRELVWRICASGLSGLCIEKFFVLNGGGGNGKGWLNEFMMYCLGDYYADVDVSLLQKKYKPNSSSPNPSLANIDKKRYIVFKEPSASKGLDNDEIKRLTGGGKLKGRILYSNKTDILLFNTTFLECNDRAKMP